MVYLLTILAGFWCSKLESCYFDNSAADVWCPCVFNSTHIDTAGPYSICCGDKEINPQNKDGIWCSDITYYSSEITDDKNKYIGYTYYGYHYCVDYVITSPLRTQEMTTHLVKRSLAKCVVFLCFIV